MANTYATTPDNGATWTAKRHAPATYANNTSPPSDADLATIGQYPEVYPDPAVCSAPCCSPSTDPTLVDGQAVYIAVNLNDEDCATVQRDQLQARVKAQSPVPDASAIALDPQAQGDTIRQQSAVTAKLNDLENTLDEDLDAFDPTVTATPANNATVARSQLTVEITDLTPWVGAPDKDIGVKVVLRTAEGREADGDELRVDIIDSPTGPRGPLPSVQDATDPRVWAVTSEDGYMWDDRDSPATVRCRWGSGSVYVTPEITTAGYGAQFRVPAPIEYGLP